MNDVLITKHISKKMSDARRRELSDELARTINDRNRIAEQQKLIQEQGRAILKLREKTITELAEQIEQGIEMEPVSCRIECDVTTNTVLTRRVDTGEILESRAMLPDERARMVDPKRQGTGRR